MQRVLKISTIVAILAFTTASAEYEGDNSITDTPERKGKLGGAAASLLTNIAQDLITRSTSSSQVLSLNLTNLVILLVLKAIIFGAGSLGFGHLGRSVDPQATFAPKSDPIVSESELLLVTSYLRGDMNQKYGCLHRIACENPAKAKDYVFAADMILKGTSLFSKSVMESRHSKILADLREAVNYGSQSRDCSIRYTCERT